jgi:phage recombination protein Bet
MNVAALRTVSPQPLGWWSDPKMLSLVQKTAFKDCNQVEFDEAVAVARELNLSPLRKQIYAFVFSRDNPKKRNMVLVVSIDGARAIAARHKNYRPDNRKPRFETDDVLKGPANPLGIISAEVSAFCFVQGEWHKIVGVAYWGEAAPVKSEPEEFTMQDTGQKWPDGNAKMRKVPKPGSPIIEKLDPDKDGWRKMPHLMLAKCAEMQALRKGWPEDLSRVYAEEETDRSRVLEGVEYTDLTPSEMAAKGDTDARLERLGGPALFATFDDSGTLERVPFGQFADRMLAVTEKLEPAAVAALVDRNREALREFWAHNANDALELRKILEKRSGVTSGAAPQGDVPAKAAASQQGERDTGAAAQPSRTVQPKLTRLTGLLAERHRDNLIRQIAQLETQSDLLYFGKDANEEIERLPSDMQEGVRSEFSARQRRVLGS